MVHQTGVHCMVNEMLPRFYVRLDHAFGFLAVLLFTISRSLEVSCSSFRFDSFS